jgi:hypothetical protein
MSQKNNILLLPKTSLVIDSSLLVYFDSYNYLTYPSAGLTTVKNLYGSINGSLINTPTFSSSSVGGIFTFNGTNQYINLGNDPSLQITIGTISAWVRATNGNSGYRGIITKQNAWGLFLLNNVFICYDWGNAQPRSTGITIGNSTWYNVAMSFTQTIGTPSNNVILYLNGSPVLTTTVKHSVNTVSVQIAWANFSGQYLIGDIAQGMIYNRVLTPTEILQNYNATKSRFGY